MTYRTRNGPSEVIGTPVCYENRVYVTIGQDPLHGSGVGCVTCIDATKTGDISKSGKIWEFRDIDRSLSTVSIADGLLYVGDFTGNVHCLDLDTGKQIWKQETQAYMWANTFVADGKVYFGDTTGMFWIMAAGREKKVINKIMLDSPIHQTPDRRERRDVCLHRPAALRDSVSEEVMPPPDAAEPAALARESINATPLLALRAPFITAWFDSSRSRGYASRGRRR